MNFLNTSKLQNWQGQKIEPRNREEKERKRREDILVEVWVCVILVKGLVFSKDYYLCLSCGKAICIGAEINRRIEPFLLFGFYFILLREQLSSKYDQTLKPLSSLFQKLLYVVKNGPISVYTSQKQTINFYLLKRMKFDSSRSHYP